MKGVFNHETNEFITAYETFKCFKIPSFNYQYLGTRYRRTLGVWRKFPINVTINVSNLYLITKGKRGIGYVKPFSDSYVGAFDSFEYINPLYREKVKEETNKILKNLK
jgi:hypothetical protein